MRILLVIHGLPHDETTLCFGAQVARQAGETPTVLTVVGSPRERAGAGANLGRARDLLAAAQVPQVETRVRQGTEMLEILREAREGRYDLLVVGERQRPGLLTRLMNGFDSVHLVEQAPCSVAIVMGEVRPVQKILLCDSGAGGPLAEAVLLTPALGPSLLARFTAQLASLLQGQEEITVLHVMSQIGAGPGIEGKQLQADAEQLMEERTPEGEMLLQDVQVLVRPGAHTHPKIRHGLVLDEILAEARGGDYDLVVIGAHRGARWQRLLLDDLARKIILHIDRPLLVVK